MENKPPLPMAPTPWFGRIMEWFNGPTYRLALSLMEAPPGTHLLEIGFGSGRLLELFARRTSDIYLAGIEPTKAMVEMAQSRKSLRKIGNRLDLRQGTAHDLPWADETFNGVAALHCFQFWENPEQCAREIRRVLKPQARLVLILRNHEKHAPDWLPNPISKSPDEFQGAVGLLKRNGFSDVGAAGHAGSSKAIIAFA